MALYKVIAQVVRTVDGWTSSVGCPTFWVEACSAENACTIGRMVADPHTALTVHLSTCLEDGADYLAKSFDPEGT